MFDKAAVDEYRSLTAPEILKQRVLHNASQRKQRNIRILPLVSALAACLVLVFASTWLDVQDDVMISSDWNLNTTSLLALPASATSRISANHYANFTLAVRDKLKLETDDTLFILTDEGELINTFPYKSSEVVRIYWYITTPEAQMTVNGVSYTLTADEDNGTFQIVQD